LSVGDSVDHHFDSVAQRVALELHSQLFHNVSRRTVFGLRHGDDPRQAGPLERIQKGDSCGFGAETLPPVGPGQPPPDLNLTLVVLEPAEADQRTGSFLDELPEAKAIKPRLPDLGLDEVPDAFVGPQFPRVDIAHDVGVLGNGTEIEPVRKLPLGHPEPLSFKPQAFSLKTLPSFTGGISA